MALPVKATLLVSCLALASCSAGNAVKVRATADPIMLSKDNAIGLARAQLMLGNVGLALEGFRKALRDNASDTAALAGIGDCYAAMNRYDLAQSSYEQALALSPHDPSLLVAIAGIFDQQGQHAQAAVARAEAAAAVAPRPQLEQPVAAPTAMRPPVVASARAERTVGLNTAAIGTITVELPAAKPAKRLSGHDIAAEEQTIAPAAAENGRGRALVTEIGASVPIRESAADPVKSAPAVEKVGEAPKPALPERRTPFETAAMKAADVQLARPAAKLQRDLIALLLSKSGVAGGEDRRRNKSVEMSDPIVAPAPRPRLERLSRGEVALITTSTPVWRPAVHQSSATATAVVWLPLIAGPREANVQILNAARKQGIAAAARSILSHRGWKKIAVGDAPAVQHRSVVLYPASRRTIGRRLAAQFGIASRLVEGNAVVLVLGRDCVSRMSGRQAS